MSMNSDKIDAFENSLGFNGQFNRKAARFRRILARRGMSLVKSKRRNPQAFDYGGFMIVDISTNAVVAGADPLPFCMSIDDVEAWLKD
jgi:hypothetical protein